MRIPSPSSVLGIWVVRTDALPLARKIRSEHGGKIYGPYPSGTGSIKFRQCWGQHTKWILIMTTGIAIRYLDGLPQHKAIDPAVVTVDEGARFCISLLSGHEGGANVLAYQVSETLSSLPVITTATESLKSLVLGIGCRKGATSRQIDLAVRLAMRRSKRKLHEIREVATVDLKRFEPGLRQWCSAREIPLRVFSRADLMDRSHVTVPSLWVQKHTGLPGICESCALNATPRGRLILPKISRDGVAVALVED